MSSFQPLIQSGILIGQTGGSGGGGVTSINGVMGAITLAAGSGITITPSGTTFTISSTGGGGSGTVTNFTFTNGGGFTGTVTNSTTTPTLSLVGTLSGDITGSLTSTALTATTNSTLTTLSSLSLPASQVTGLPPINGFTKGSVLFANSSGQIAQDNSNIFWNDTSHFLGIGTATPIAALDVETTVTVTSGTIMGSREEIMINPSGNSTATYEGFNNITATSSGNPYNMYLMKAAYAEADHKGSGTLTYATALGGAVYNAFAGTITNAFGAFLGTYISNGGTITNGYGAYVDSPSNNGGGTFTNFYGLYISNPTAATNNYSIYSAGGTNYFAGPINAPGGITGNLTGTATNITAVTNSTLTTLSSLSLPYTQVTGTPYIGTFFKQNITLASGDITNQYVNLAHLVIQYSLTLAVDKAYQVENDDYILSTVGGVTRLTFNNALASGGVSALVAGDVLNLQYSY